MDLTKQMKKKKKRKTKLILSHKDNNHVYVEQKIVLG